MGFYTRDSGRPSVTWPESVDEALCVGWIDGVRKNVDGESYCIRFTPRRTRSRWSAVNIRRVGELNNQGRMQPAGLRAFEARVAANYSFEQKPVALAPDLEKGCAPTRRLARSGTPSRPGIGERRLTG